MKKLPIASLLIISIFIFSACSSPVASFTNKISEIVNPNTTIEKSTIDLQEIQPTTVESDTNPTPLPQSSEVGDLLAAYQSALENVYINVNPSVVNINVKKRITSENFQMPNGAPFQFPSIPGVPQSPDDNQVPEPEIPQYQQGLGSGFVWDEQGYIVSNNHVVEAADEIEVTFHDGSIFSAELVGTDPNSDLAVLKIDADEDLLQPVSIADSNDIRVGQLGIAIGNPYGLEGTMTVGIISAIGRSMPISNGMQTGPVYSIPDVIQTDAPINPGNSGGVLVNDQGQMLGVTYAIESSSGSNAGIGFVIPSNIVKKVIPELIRAGSYQHPYLGITGLSLSPDIAEAMGLDANQRGALVIEVSADGPAGKAGLEGSTKVTEIDGQELNVGGDVIIAIDNQTVKEMDDLIAYLSRSTEVGQKVSLTIIRDSKEMKFDVTLEARPTDSQTNQQQSTMRPNQTNAWLGFRGFSLVPEVAKAMDLPSDQSGVLIEQIDIDSPADEAGLLGGSTPFSYNGEEIMIGGDIVIGMEGEKVETIFDLLEILSRYEPNDQVLLKILRNGENIELEVTLGVNPQ
jgi:serine protease Do